MCISIGMYMLSFGFSAFKQEIRTIQWDRCMCMRAIVCIYCLILKRIEFEVKRNAHFRPLLCLQCHLCYSFQSQFPFRCKTMCATFCQYAIWCIRCIYIHVHCCVLKSDSHQRSLHLRHYTKHCIHKRYIYLCRRHWFIDFDETFIYDLNRILFSFFFFFGAHKN